VSVTLHNLYDISWCVNAQFIWDITQSYAMIFATELLVDWLKHAFITKFNNISADYYLQYLRIIQNDALSSSCYVRNQSELSFSKKN
jgi:hypothetical protein